MERLRAWRLHPTDFSVPETTSGIPGGSGTVFRAVYTRGVTTKHIADCTAEEKAERRACILILLQTPESPSNEITFRKVVAIKKMRIRTDEHEVLEKTLEVGVAMRRDRTNHA